nr:uncharacterized protein LOC112274545 isoform X2 [Physcomitrium patens]|eukprot:XP_024359966.1 uncharacterized protein LOC112274545 isoform X2 [Physcomitrella patens]
METAAMLGSSAVSKTTQVASSKMSNLGAIEKCRLQLDYSMTGTVAAFPQRMKNVIKMLMGDMGSKEGVVKTVSEIKAENKAMKLPTFPFLDLYEFICCKRELEIHSNEFKPGEELPALVIGISAPQSCGQTTIVYSLEYMFNSLGRYPR